MKTNEQYLVKGYIPTIGIECHVQLKTNTKLFAGVSNDARDAKPNTLISHICLGMPGALPVLNEKAVELSVRAAFALSVDPQEFSKFDRKHYFYPDLPKGYQITQFDEPIILGGHVDIEVGGDKKQIRVTRAHLEEDAGKNTHPPGADYSLVDLNRAGTPLLEIVSEPDMHSPAEAKAYAKELHSLMRYAGVSDADLYHGNMRFDVNVSVGKSGDELGTRTETKNLNSFKSVEKAVAYEIDRQIQVLENGGLVTQETRGWDDAKQKTFSQRSKEEAHDYRYFPEPDLPPVVLDLEMVRNIKSEMPVMPAELRAKLRKLDIDESTVSTIIDALPAGKIMYVVMEDASALSAKRIANWLATDVQGIIAEDSSDWDTVLLDAESLKQLDSLVAGAQISSTGAKAVLKILVTRGGDPMVIAKEHDLLQVSDSNEIEAIVTKVLDQNPKAVEDIKNGETKVIGFLVGQVMKQTGGKANPPLVQQAIKKQLKI